MSIKTLNLTPALYQYLLDNSIRDCSLHQEIRAETAALAMGNMQVSPEHGQLLALLVELTGATSILEIGVFTGYSSLLMASALPEDGKLIACDISEEWTAIAKRYWRKAKVGNKIDLRLAPALETLSALAYEGKVFDLVFIDADKINYDSYYEAALALVRQGGLIVLDNTLWSGQVADDAFQDDDTIALRKLNKKIHHDERVSLSLIPIGDGLTLARKR